MARIRNAGKKSLWLNLTPHQKFFAFCRGDRYVKDVWASEFAWRIYSLFENVDSSDQARAARASNAAFVGKSMPDYVRGPMLPLRIFKKVRKESIEFDSQELIKEAVEMLFNCYREKNGTQRLRNLADCIDEGRKRVRPAVDPNRAWLWIKFSPANNVGNHAQTFAKIRDAFDAKFPNNSMADSQLRVMVKEVGIKTIQDKKGPKGPTIK